MTKSELIVKIYERYPELGRALVEDAVSLFFSEIGGCLSKGQRVELRGFGSFSLRKREGRTGRNPKTGEAVVVQEKWTPFFKAGKELRETINKPQVRAGLPTSHLKGLSGLHNHQHAARS
jgi:integration host factor subunit beta